MSLERFHAAQASRSAGYDTALAELASEDEMKTIDAEIRTIVNGAAEFAQSDPEPDPSELWTDVLIEA